MINYSEYKYQAKEYIQYVMIGSMIGALIGYVFYESLFAMVLLLPYGFFYAKEKKKQLIEQRKWKLNQEFGDGLDSLSASLRAGYAVENAFKEALKNLKLIYKEDAYIIVEFKIIVDKLNKNLNLDEILDDLSRRSSVEDIYNFTQVFNTAIRTGGDLIKIINNTNKIISDKVNVKREILTLIAAKKYEAKIMNVIPIAIILYLKFFSPEFLNPLYHNAFGVIFMTVILIAYYLALKISQRIMDIKV